MINLIDTQLPELSTALNMRQAMYNFMYGTDTQPPRGRLVVLQKVKRDVNGAPIESPYSYKLTGEGKDRNRGPATTRSGLLCDEFWIRAYFRPSGRLVMDEMGTPMGEMITNRVVINTAYIDELNQHDVIIIPEENDDGLPISPITIKHEYVVTLSYPRTLEGGTIVYFTTVAEIQK